MSFVQLDYLAFLLLVLGLFQFVPVRMRIAYLLVASIVFYLHDQPIYLVLLAVSSLLDFGVGLGMGRTQKQRTRRWLLGCSLAGNLGLLGVFKYAGVFLGDSPDPATDNPVLGGASSLPLGISFYTFQTLGYSIDVFRGRVQPCRSWSQYALYVSFFPQLICGPIERARHLLPQLTRLQLLNPANLSLGSRWILWGLAKKLVIADRFRPLLLEVFHHPEGVDSLTLLTVNLGLLVILYLDFSGYIDIARGSAVLFGVRLVPNFRSPFLATSVGAFAGRWHTSLISWLRENLYRPLMRMRSGALGILWINLLLFGLVGLWHGARWTYILSWGSAGLVITLEQWARRSRRTREGPVPRRGALLPWLFTMLYLALFTAGFYSLEMATATANLRSVFGGGMPSAESLPFLGRLLGLLAVGLVLHGAGSMMNLVQVWNRVGRIGRTAWFLLLAGIVLRFQVVEIQPFDYFRF
ncbi:MAG TPA: MBOAT family protein [Planctomycetes bacterium]|nr:MBOAT family protein [Planctomycetota bacterium]HIK60828.1 MBOAT family protein [Planctomycetota bacterium]